MSDKSTLSVLAQTTLDSVTEIRDRLMRDDNVERPVMELVGEMRGLAYAINLLLKDSR